MTNTFLFLLALFVNATIGIACPNLVTSIASTVLFLAAVAMLFRADPRSVWLLLPFIWLQFTVLLSLNFAEAGAYMPEMDETGHRSTAAISYGLVALLTVGVAMLTRRALVPRLVGRTSVAAFQPGCRPVSLLDLGVLTFAAGASLYLLSAGLRTGFPLLTHTDRFMYRRLDADVITVDLLDLQLLPALALGAARLTTASSVLRAVYAGLFALLLLDSALFGDKFTILLMSLLAFLTPRMISAPAMMTRMAIRLLPAFVLVAILMTGATLFIYSDYGALGIGDTMQLIGDRIGGQGELWYVTVEHNAALFRLDLKSIGGVLASTLYKNPADYMFQHRLGPYSFVELYAPPIDYHAVIDDQGSVTPTMGLEAYGLALFGYAGLLVQIAMTGILLAGVTIFIERGLRSGNPLRILFPAFLLNATLKFFAQGTLFNICSVPLFKSYAAFLLFDLVIVVLARSASPALSRRPAPDAARRLA